MNRLHTFKLLCDGCDEHHATSLEPSKSYNSCEAHSKRRWYQTMLSSTSVSWWPLFSI